MVAADAPETIELDTLPELTPMLARVALGALPIPGVGGRASADGLPDTTVVLRGARIDLAHLADYAEVCGFRLGSTLPPTYLHMLGFPLSVQLMTRPDFPFSLLGMVHVRNHITTQRPVDLGETVDITAGVGNLRPHPKGQQMDNVVTATVDGEAVWASTSTYLKRGRSDATTQEPTSTGDGTGGAADDVDVAELPMTALWRVPGDIGRRYGSVSGDRNPIHLTALSAKAFGFPRAIAHGMWTKAHALAGLEGDLPPAADIDVAFKLPLLLPATVEYATRRTEAGGRHFAVRSRDGRPHLAGVVTAR